jgi:hypothetical protein
MCSMWLLLLLVQVWLPTTSGFLSLPLHSWGPRNAASGASASARPCSRTVKMMFSGIVEDIGTVTQLVINPTMPLWDGSVGEGVELTVSSDVATQEAYIGCSIAVNGVCLTATHLPTEGGFTVNLAPETLRRTNLGILGKGRYVCS